MKELINSIKVKNTEEMGKLVTTVMNKVLAEHLVSMSNELNIPVPTVQMVEGVHAQQACIVYDYEAMAISGEVISATFKRVMISPCTIAVDIMTLFPIGMRTDVTEDYCKAILLHELRHVYQVYHNPSILKVGICDGLLGTGYGSIPCEKDANMYALDKATTGRGALVARVFIMAQDFAGKALTSVDIERRNFLLGRLIKEWVSINVKPIGVVAMSVIGMGICALIKRRGGKNNA